MRITLCSWSIEIKISDIARKYGVRFIGGKALCPFHKLDLDCVSTLIFDDDLNTFYCEECGARGDLNEFVRRVENGLL